MNQSSNPDSFSQSTCKHNLVGIVLFALLLTGWWYALFQVTTESHQGEVYRILYLHVACASTAFLSSFFVGLFGLLTLLKDAKWEKWGKGSAEVGLLFTVLTLVTGSIWAKPTWGTWWTWDARLTTMFILFLLYCGYQLLWASLSHSEARVKACAVLSILICADIPIIYKSVDWWRTLHQPPSIVRSGGSTMAPEMLWVLLYCTIITIALSVWFVVVRRSNLLIKEKLESIALKGF